MAGNKGTKTPAQQMTAMEREDLVLRMRVQGKSFEDCAQAAGYQGPSGKAAAYKAMRRALHRIPEQAARDMREIEEARFDSMLESVWNRAMRGDTYAIDTVLKIQAQRARLFGLNKEADQGPGVTVQKAYINLNVEEL